MIATLHRKPRTSPELAFPPGFTPPRNKAEFERWEDLEKGFFAWKKADLLSRRGKYAEQRRRLDAVLLNLLPLYKRAIDLLEEMQNSRRHLLTYTSYHRTYLDWRHIAQQLGLSEPQGLPAQVRQATLEYLASYDPKFYEVEVQRLDMREIEDVASPVTSSRVSVLLEPWETLWRLTAMEALRVGKKKLVLEVADTFLSDGFS